MHAITQGVDPVDDDFIKEMAGAAAGLHRLVDMLGIAQEAVQGVLENVEVHTYLCSLCAHMHTHLM